MLEESLANTVTRLKERLGEKRENWQWGKIHKIRYQHPGATSWLARRYLNLGPYPIGGDNNTVNAGVFNPAKDRYDVLAIPSMRMIVDMADVNGALVIGSMGQSGQPQHRHYSDMINLWRNGRYIPMYFSKEDVIANQKAMLILKP